MRILAVVPAYNEATRIAGVIAELRSHFSADILVIDDGSTDGTAPAAKAAGARVCIHAVNLGYGAALQTGYRYALRCGYDAVVQLDADGQHDPSCIPDLCKELDKADVVIGSRFLPGSTHTTPFVRRLGMRLFAFLATLLSGKQVTDPTSGFQALSRAALSFYTHERYPVDFPDADVLAMGARVGLRLCEVPVRMRPSPPGKSMHSGIIAPFYYVIRMSIALSLVLLRNERR